MYIIKLKTLSVNAIYRINFKTGCLYKTTEAKKWVESAKEQISKQLTPDHSIMDCKIKMIINVYYNDNPDKRDLDNTLKLILDSIKNLLIVDDKQIYEIYITKSTAIEPHFTLDLMKYENKPIGIDI